MKTTGSKKIAERYVSALFEIAQGADAVAEVEADLQGLAKLLQGSEDFRDFLSNPLLTREQSAQAADALLAKLGAHKITRQFVQVVARQKRLEALGAIIDLFLEAAAGARGEMSAELVSAQPFPKVEAKKLAEKLGKAYGKKITLSLREDPNLLGGAVITIGSLQLDASLAGKLQRLRQVLKAA